MVKYSTAELQLLRVIMFFYLISKSYSLRLHPRFHGEPTLSASPFLRLSGHSHFRALLPVPAEIKILVGTMSSSLSKYSFPFIWWFNRKPHRTGTQFIVASSVFFPWLPNVNGYPTCPVGIANAHLPLAHKEVRIVLPASWEHICRLLVGGLSHCISNEDVK